MPADSTNPRRFAIAISFPGEHRAFVEQVAGQLASQFSKERVLYDKYHDAEFARLDLNTYLPALYRKDSELIVIFLCPQYAAKLWCRLEWRHISQLIATVDAKRIMFLSFGNPGDLSDLGILGGDAYIDILPLTPQVVAEKIIKRLSLNQGITPPPMPLDSAPTTTGRFPLKWVFLVLLVLVLAIFAVIYPHILTQRRAATSAPKVLPAVVPTTTVVFQPPSPELQVQIDSGLAEFKSRYADWHPTVRIEVEAGSISRRKLAEALGGVLQAHSLGGFASGTFVGVAPDSPMTFFFGAGDDSCARAFQTAVAPLISGQAVFLRDRHLRTNMIRFYLNGNPLFRTNGNAILQ